MLVNYGLVVHLAKKYHTPSEAIAGAAIAQIIAPVAQGGVRDTVWYPRVDLAFVRADLPQIRK